MAADKPQDRLARRAPWILLAPAAAAVEVVILEEQRGRIVAVLASVAWLVLILASVWAGARLVRRRARISSREEEKPPPVVLAYLTALLAVSFPIEMAREIFLGQGLAPELLLVAALRNLGFGLAILADWRICRQLAALVSLFLVLLAASLTHDPLVIVPVGVYAVAGSLWLMGSYWSGLHLQRGARPGLRLPLAAALLVAAVAASVAWARQVGLPQLAKSLSGILPTSGGTRYYQRNARSGVNDGDDEVSGVNAQSLGTIESDVFLDSPEPTLYDLFNEQYGKPFKPKEQERAIALSSERVLSGHHAPESRKAAREFMLKREHPRGRAPTEDDGANALLYVSGRTPVHLRLTAYDRFDGVAWLEAPLMHRPAQLCNEPESPWMEVEQRLAEIFSGEETHLIKIGGLKTSTLPMPASLRRFRMGKVNQPDFFAWAQDEILRLPRRSIPVGTAIETVSRTVDPRLLGERGPAQWFVTTLAESAASPLDPACAELARRWAGDLPRGWLQVDAVVGQLRQLYVHDWAARPPAECRDIVHHFLLESHRGPDYLFASSAALLLRSLGYSTRLVSGFYANPEHYDSHSRYTLVHEDDVHFWLELRLSDGSWVPVEPTPGYELLGPTVTWTERLWNRVRAVGAWMCERTLDLLAVAAVLGLLFWFRREVLDRLATFCWWMTVGRAWPASVARTLWLLEQRASWAGRARPVGQTPWRWYVPVAITAPAESRTALEQLLRLNDWAAYAPPQPNGVPPWTSEEIHGACYQAVYHWTLGRFRAAPGQQRSGEVLS